MKSKNTVGLLEDKISLGLLASIVLLVFLVIGGMYYIYAYIPQFALQREEQETEANRPWWGMQELYEQEKYRFYFGIVHEESSDGVPVLVFKPSAKQSEGIDRALEDYNAVKEPEFQVSRSDFDSHIKALCETYFKAEELNVAANDFIDWAFEPADVVPVESMDSGVLPERNSLDLNEAVTNYYFALHKDSYPGWEYRAIAEKELGIEPVTEDETKSSVARRDGYANGEEQ